MLKTKYRVIEVEALDCTIFWLEKTTYIFGWRVWVKSIGDYVDTEHGDIDVPFFTYSDCENRIKQLKKK